MLRSSWRVEKKVKIEMRKNLKAKKDKVDPSPKTRQLRQAVFSKGALTAPRKFCKGWEISYWQEKWSHNCQACRVKWWYQVHSSLLGYLRLSTRLTWWPRSFSFLLSHSLSSYWHPLIPRRFLEHREQEQNHCLTLQRKTKRVKCLLILSWQIRWLWSIEKYKTIDFSESQL